MDLAWAGSGNAINSMLEPVCSDVRIDEAVARDQCQVPHAPDAKQQPGKQSCAGPYPESLQLLLHLAASYWGQLLRCIDSDGGAAYDCAGPYFGGNAGCSRTQNDDQGTMNKQVFFDPQRKRWKRLRRIFDVMALAGVVVGVLFVIGLLRMTPLPELLLSSPKRNISALQSEVTPPRGGQKPHKTPARRKTTKLASDVTLNSGEGLRAAYYVEDDPASYSSLKQHIRQIDLLFPEWIHVVSPDGGLTSYSLDNRAFNVVDANGVRPVDHEQRVARAIASAGVDATPAEIFPMVNNYDPISNSFLRSIGDFLANPTARANFVQQIDKFLGANPSYRGISLDFEEIPSEAQQSYMALLATLYQDFQARHLRLYVNVPVNDDDFDLKYIADHSDGLLLMNYEQHLIGTGPGPIASQDWFIDNLKNVLQIVPKEKIICSIGSYGYDWTTTIPVAAKKGTKAQPAKVLSTDEMSTQAAWQAAEDADAHIELDPDSLNVHFAYDDEDAHVRHQIWFLDAVTDPERDACRTAAWHRDLRPLASGLRR